MKSSKLALSSTEWQMAASSEVILTKNKIIENVYEMYGQLCDDFRLSSSLLAHKLPSVFAMNPKISRGENYEAMPWVMLDYPRCYSKEEGHFAIRCFFWWGHFFSISLQLSGKYLKDYNQVLPMLQGQGWDVGLTDNPWSQHLPNTDWQPYLTDNFDFVSHAFPYAKAAKKIPVADWPQVKYFLEKKYEELMQVISPHS